MASNQNYILASDGIFYSEEELYHFGVKGMKWGVRKASYDTERTAYKQSKKNYRELRRDLSRSSWTAFGRAGLRNYKTAEKKVNKAELDMLDAKAKYKAAKSKNGEKAAANVYRKAMYKSGLVGSAADDASGGRSTRLYNHLKVTRGKAYADAIEKKVENQAVTTFAVGAAVAVGATVVSAILESA